jgi:hypothetical protein
MAQSGTFAIFKGKGAAKFSQIGPTRNQNGWVKKNGAVLLEAAPAVGTRPDGLPLYDWDQKISFAIGIQDITQLFDPKTDKLFHKSTSGGFESTKTLKFVPGTGNYEGTYQMFLNQSHDDQNNKVFVPLSAGEYLVLQRLLISSVPMMLGWE